MPNLVPVLLPLLEEHRLPGLDAGPRVIYPHYQGYSLANLPSSICSWLGVPSFGASPLAETILNSFPQGGPFQNVILLLVDGLGLKQFQRLLQPEHEKTIGSSVWTRLLPDALLSPLTSVVPSTTSAALTTLWTGVLPAEHGIVGYEVWLKEYSVIANMIFHSPASFSGDTGGLKRAGFQPEAFLPVPTLGPHLVEHGVQPYSFQPGSIARSGLSVMHMPQVNIVPYRTLSDLWVSLANLLESRPGERKYIYSYWGDLDELMHRYGPDDERVMLELASFSLLLERFLAGLRNRGRRNTLFLMLADHGQIFTPRNSSFELKNHPDLAGCLSMLPSGEGRFSYLFVRPGRETQVQAYVEHAWHGQFRLLPVDQVVRSGLLGDANRFPRVLDRLGDWILIAQDDAYLWWADRENPMLGRHGGLNSAEMLVPLVGMLL
jgi:hypothetical protein